MAPLIYLDTHVVAWLFSARIDLLPAGVRTRIEESDLLISPAVKLELEYLYEIHRITSSGEHVVSDPSSAARAYVEKELVVKLEYW
jgi:hypothetical protein